MILFGHVVDLLLVFYVWYRLYQDQVIDRRVKRNFYLAGIFIAGLLACNQVWQLVWWLKEDTPSTDRILNMITSFGYSFMPPAIVLLLWMNQKIEKRSESIFVCLACILFFLIPIGNCFFPLLFVTEHAIVTSLGGNLLYSGVELLFLIWLLYRYYTKSFTQFTKDKVLLLFVVLSVVLGQVAEFLNEDYETSWGSIAIAYLLLYFAVQSLYDKTDLVTHTANNYSYLNISRMIRRKDYTIALMDIDGLKKYNDTEGHLKGDEYLRAFAQAIGERFKDKGMFFRTGGDEFVLISKMPLEEMESELSEERNHVHRTKKGDFLLKFSYGITEKSRNESTEEAYARADAKMYQMKNLSKEERKAEDHKDI